MAKMTDAQMRFRMNRLIRSEAELKKKVELQQEEERQLLNEVYKKEVKKEKEKEMSGIVAKEEPKKGVSGQTRRKRPAVGGYALPSVYDSVDLTEFLEPLDAFRDRYGEEYKLYLTKYRDFKKTHAEIFDKINRVLYPNEMEDTLADAEGGSKGYNDRMKVLEKVKRDFFESSFTHFQQFVPIYNKYVCSCCGQAKDITQFYVLFDHADLSRIDAYGNIRTHVCKECANKLFNYFYNEVTERDAEGAMKRFCASMNIYWSAEHFSLALRNMELHDAEKHVVEEYLELVNSDMETMGKTFLDSPFLENRLIERDELDMERLSEVDQKRLSIDDINNTAILDWSRDDLINRRNVIKAVGYDVFDYESPENRKQLYSDLLGVLEPGMEQDSVKLQAAIQIVTSFLKIREMNKEYREMQNAGASLADLKVLADLKQKEMTAITKFAQDNGFSARFATAKSKGENTFTGILKRMTEDKFEDAIFNAYDVATSESIQQCADASIKAIFSQLAYSESDAFKTVADQLAELEKLRKQLDDLQEENRKLKYQAKKKELEEKAKEEGVWEDDLADDELFLEDLKR